MPTLKGTDKLRLTQGLFLISGQGRAMQQHNARTHPANVQAAELIRLYRKEGLTYQAIADRLNGMGFRTRRGKAFLVMSVQRLDTTPAPR